MTRKLRVGVIFGGRSGEHEVSLVSATSVVQALDRTKYDVVLIGITPEGRWISSANVLGLLKAKAGLESEPERFLVPEPNRQGLISLDGAREVPFPLDVVFPVIHGTFGEDGALQGLLELADIPYVGAGVLSSAVGMDKIVQKQLFEQAGLPVGKYRGFLSSECREHSARVIRNVERDFRYPVFVKPANTGSSVGISKAHHRRELVAGIALAAEYDRKIVVEQGINGAREIECGILGNDEPIASVPGEVIPSNEFYDYDAKYVDGKSEAIIPARLPRQLAMVIRRLAVKAYRVLDCAGMARADFFVTKKARRVYVNELNTIPGFTSISMYPKLWEATGIGYTELLDRLIQLALDRHTDQNRLSRTYRPHREWYRS